MKKIKKSILNFAILLVVALCPLFLAACTKTPQNQLSSQQKYSKAIGASINKIKNYQTSALQSLNYQEVSEDLSSNLIMVDYMKRSGSSDYVVSDCKSLCL